MTDAPGLRPRPGSGGGDDGRGPQDARTGGVVEGRPTDEGGLPRPSLDGKGAPGATLDGKGAPGATLDAKGAPGATPDAPAGGIASSRLGSVSGSAPAPTQPSTAAPRPVPVPTGRVTPAPRGRRRAKLAVASIDPWSVFRFTLVFSVTLLIVWVVVAGVLWSLLNGMHVFDSLTSLINDTFLSTKNRTVDELFNFKRTIVWAAGLGVLNAILFTALGTLGAFVYNLCARIVGGIEVTLSDRG